MKDRAREAVFNLIGPSIKGSYAIDLFAGTGALALEAISRGSHRALAIERHFPTADVIIDNARSLGIRDQVEVYPGDTFIWARRMPDLGRDPCVVFCSPPYALYEDRADDVLNLIGLLIQAVPNGSNVIVEGDSRLDWQTIPSSDEWDVRSYHPAEIGIWRKTANAT